LNFNKLSLQGFKSFETKQELDFSTIKGFTLITGSNEVEVGLGANGTGKSSLAEGITFCLFGKTSSNLKAGDLSSWNSKIPTKCCLDFIKDEVEYKLERTWNPNSLTLNSQIIPQAEVESTVGLNFESFLYSILISQFSEKFIDMQPSNKMDIFTKILGKDLSKWDEFSDKAKILAKEKQGLVWADKTKLEVLTSNILEIRKQLKINKDKKEKYEVEVKKDLKELKDVFVSTHLEVNKNKKDIEDFKKEQTIMEETIDKINEEIAKLTGELIIVGEGERDLKREFDKIYSERKELENLIKDLPESKSLCYTCGKVLSEEDLIIRRKELKNRIKILEINLKKFEKQESSLSLFKKDIVKLKKEKSEDYEEVKKETERFTKLITKAALENSAAEEKTKSIAENILKLSITSNPFKEVLEDYLKNFKETITKKRLITKSLNDNTNYYEAYTYWIKGFKDLKLLITYKYLKEFEIEINNNLQKFGMLDWTIILDIDSQNKSGSLRKGFTVTVNSPINDSLVPFECWSGGEGQRLRLAITLGLVDFIKNQRGIFSNLLILDEPTQFLSNEGISDLIRLLKDKSKEDEISIMLIDQRNLSSFGEFDNILQVIKDKNGSRIVL